jgi:hypothetical protein
MANNAGRPGGKCRENSCLIGPGIAVKSVRMKFVLASIPYLLFALLIAAGIVRAAQPEGSSWLLILSMVAFIAVMGRCCLPAKH